MIPLYLDKATGKVEASSEFLTRPEVKKLMKDPKFGAICCGAYWILRPRNLYSNKSLSERIKVVNDDYLKDFDTTWEQLLKSAGVKAFVDIYIDLTSTINDRAEENLKNDFTALMEALNEVPTKVDIDVSSGIEVMCEDKVLHRTTKASKVTIPNFEQKDKLWDSYLKYSNTLKKVQEALKIEEEERAKTGSDVWLYDNEQSNSTMKVVSG